MAKKELLEIAIEENVAIDPSAPTATAKRVLQYGWDYANGVGRRLAVSPSGSPLSPDQALNHEADATWDYFAVAPPGTALSASAWKVFRLNSATVQKQYANGTAGYQNPGQNLSSLTYA